VSHGFSRRGGRARSRRQLGRSLGLGTASRTASAPPTNLQDGRARTSWRRRRAVYVGRFAATARRSQAKVRATLEKAIKIPGQKKTKVKVGHGGTLDPAARGVLVLGVGNSVEIKLSLLLIVKSAWR